MKFPGQRRGFGRVTEQKGEVLPFFLNLKNFCLAFWEVGSRVGAREKKGLSMAESAIKEPGGSVIT